MMKLKNMSSVLIDSLKPGQQTYRDYQEGKQDKISPEVVDQGPFRKL